MRIIKRSESEFIEPLGFYATIFEDAEWFEGEVSETKGGGGGGTTSTQTVEKSDPWGGQQPFLTYGFEEAKANYQNDAPEYFAGNTYIPYSNETIDGLNQISNVANSNPLPFAAANESYKTLNGDYLNNNPYMDQIAGSVTGDVMAGVNSTFNQSGRFGSNSHADTLAGSIGDTMAKLRGQSYETERENMQRAGVIAPQTNAMQYDNANQLMNVGGAYEGKQYEVLQDQIARHNFEQSQPDAQLANYMNLVQGNYGQSSTRTGTAQQPTYGGNALQGALGGALSGFSSFGIPGAIGGGLLGGLFS